MRLENSTALLNTVAENYFHALAHIDVFHHELYNKWNHLFRSFRIPVIFVRIESQCSTPRGSNLGNTKAVSTLYRTVFMCI